MNVFDKMRKMMEANTQCHYSKVKCSKCRWQEDCDILQKYVRGD